MDKKTFEKYHRGEIGGVHNIVSLNNLTISEQALYGMILKHNWRLEQEKITNIFHEE